VGFALKHITLRGKAGSGTPVMRASVVGIMAVMEALIFRRLFELLVFNPLNHGLL